MICAAADCATKPPGVAWADAAVFPVPALTAEQVVTGALAVQPGETALTGGGGVAAARRTRREAGRRRLSRPWRTAADWPLDSSVTVHQVHVRPDGARLAALAELLARGEPTVEAGPSYPFEQAADALARALSGGNGKGMVLSPLRL